MSLGGRGLPILLMFLTLGLFIAIVLGPRRARSRAAGGFVRGVQTLALNLVVLTLAAVLLNNSFDFYLSWSDLFGLRSPVVATKTGGQASAAVNARVRRPPALAGAGIGAGELPALPAPGQRLQEFQVTGARSGVTGTVLVYLPAGYDAAAQTHHPVIVALHGSPGSPSSWMGPMGYGQNVDAAVAGRHLAAPVVVMPQVNFPEAGDTECVNGPPGSPQVDTWLSVDIPQWITSHFRVSGERDGWAVTGYSEGGWCAAFIGMHHPDVYGASIVYGGYFRVSFEKSYVPLGAATRTSLPYDLVQLAAKQPPPLAMWVMSSKGDGLSYPSTAKFLKAARAPLSVTSYIDRQGGHRFSLWVDATPPSLAWLGATLPGFAPR